MEFHVQEFKSLTIILDISRNHDQPNIYDDKSTIITQSKKKKIALKYGIATCIFP